MSFSTERSSGGTITMYDEGISITSAMSSLNAVGAGITATAVGNDVTITVPGGGSATLLSESSNETPNGSRTSFTFPHSVGVCIFNGVCQFVGGGLASVTTNTAVFNIAPETGDDVKNAYAG